MLQRAGVGAVATVALAGVLVGGLTAAGAVGGLPGVLDDSPESTTTTEVTVPESTTSTTETTLAPPTVPAPPTRVIDVPGIGQVVVLDGPVPTVVSVTALPGFTFQPDDDPSEPGEVHLRFFDASGGRIDVQAEYEDGQLRVRVRDRRLERSGGGSGDSSDDAPGYDDSGVDDGRRGRGRGSDDGPASGGSSSGGAPSGGSSSSSASSGGSGGGGSDDSGSDDSGRARGRGGDDSGSDDSGRGRGGDDSDSDDRSDDD